jgi:tetratricopeptide (TPR) repeat protein
MAASNVGAAELQTPDRETEGEWKYDGNCKGMESRQGWQSVQDEVLSKPLQKVIQSIVANCSSEWYRVGITLGFSHGQVQDMTFNKPTFHGKLQVIIEKRLEVDGKGKAVQALLDVCGQIMPLAVIDVMKDLGIRYIDTAWDHFLYNVSKEMRHCWKKVARHLGLGQQDLATIKMKAKSSKKRARMMLELWYFRKKGVASENDMHKILKQIRSIKLTKSQIFPENFHGDKIVCGRQKELREIASEFWGPADDKETPTEIRKYCLQVVNGMGGIGKSAISEQYATEWKNVYEDGIFYFNAESLAALHLSIRSNLHDLSVESHGGGVFDDNKIFLQHVYSKDSVLLLYDAADDLNLLKDILPRDTARVHILVTTRMSGDHPVLARARKTTSLGPLGLSAGVEALQAWRGHAGEELDEEELEFARRMVSENPIEGLPLAITHAATCMKMGRMSYKQYYELLKEEQRVLEALALDMDKLLHYFKITSLKEPLLRRGISNPSDLLSLNNEDIQGLATAPNDQHLLKLAIHFLSSSNPVHLTWQLDIETVKNTDRNAMNVLLYVSLMSCKNIPESVVRPLLFSDMFGYQYNMCVNKLKSYALVDVYENNEGCSMHLHPLVQSTLLERLILQPEELHYRLNRLAYSLRQLLPDSDPDIQRRLRDDKFLCLIPHVYAVAAKAVCIRDDETCDDLVHVACHIAYQSHHVDVALRLCDKRLKAANMSANFWQRLTALFEMGRAFELMANSQFAQVYFLEAMQLLQNGRNGDKARMKQYYELVLGKLAWCYKSQQMFDEAESLYLEELSLLKVNPEENSDRIASVLNNLALSYNESGQTERAIKTFEEVMEIKTDNSDTTCISLSASLANMGECLMENGQFEKARVFLERCVSMRRENLPGDHIDLANVIRQLSVCYQGLKRSDMQQRAMQLAEEALAIACQCLPNNHPHMAVYLSQVALCHRNAGEIDRAIQLVQESVQILKHNLPSTQYHLSACLINLGQYYSDKGMIDQAIKSLEEGLVAQRSFLSVDHPDIGKTLWNLGLAYEKLPDVGKAIETWRQCLAIREERLSSTHPDIINVLWALADITFNQELYDDSLQLNWKLCDILKRTSPQSEEMAIGT